MAKNYYKSVQRPYEQYYNDPVYNAQDYFPSYDQAESYNCLAIHPELEVVAYDIGCMILVWNMSSDSKIYINVQQQNISCVVIPKTHWYVENESKSLVTRWVHLQFMQTTDKFMETLFSIDHSGIGFMWDLANGM